MEIRTSQVEDGPPGQRKIMYHDCLIPDDRPRERYVFGLKGGQERKVERHVGYSPNWGRFVIRLEALEVEASEFIESLEIWEHNGFLCEKDYVLRYEKIRAASCDFETFLELLKAGKVLVVSNHTGFAPPGANIGSSHFPFNFGMNETN